MRTIALSASYLALALVLTSASPVAPAAPAIQSVGQIFVDAAGHATGQNVAGRLLAANGTIESFRALAIGTTVFDRIHVDGFDAGQAIAGSGSPAVTLRGSNAIVSLHDNVHSAIQVRATKPTTVSYHLAPGLTAATDAAGVVARISSAQGYIGSLVAVGGAPGTISVNDDSILARASSGSEILFLASPSDVADASYQDALVAGLASGALAAQYVSELHGSEVAASEITHDPFTLVSTAPDASGAVASDVSARAEHATLLAYDVGYETLPASSARDVAVYFDGMLAQRAQESSQVLSSAQQSAPVYFAWNDQGRTQVLVGFQGEGGHHILLSASAGASTEPQARAERAQANGSRVDGAFEAHANGKITGSFLTATIPDGAASILGFTSLSDRTEVFRNVSFGASADLRVAGPDAMSLRSAKGDLTIVDDLDTTTILRAAAPLEASFALGDGVSADTTSNEIITLDGPHGPAGALVLLGEGSLTLDIKDVVHARLANGSALLYLNGACDPAYLRAIHDGRVAARVLAGLDGASPVARAFAYAHGAHVSIEPATDGALAFASDAPVVAIEARGAMLVAKSAEDLRVTIDGAAVAAASSAQAVLDGTGSASYYAESGADGALHILLDTASQSGAAVSVRIESVVREGAQQSAQRDAFGAFHLFDDGSAMGDYVTLHADRAAGAIGGLTLVATGKPVLASLAAGHGAFSTIAGEGEPVLTLTDRDARVEVADSTNAFTRILAMQATDAAMRVAADLHTSARSDRVIEILDANDTPVASAIAIAGTLQAEGADGIRGHLDAGGSILVRMHAGIESELSDAERSMMNDAIAARRVLGQVVVDDARVAGVSYDDATITTSATHERVDVTISSAIHEGRTLILSLDAKTIPGLASGRASILYDGTPIHEASSYADVLDASDDAGQAEYFVLAGDSGASQVLLSIPHFSTHTVTLQDESRSGSSVWLYATIILGGIAVAESIVLARKARKARTNDITNERRP